MALDDCQPDTYACGYSESGIGCFCGITGHDLVQNQLSLALDICSEPSADLPCGLKAADINDCFDCTTPLAVIQCDEKLTFATTTDKCKNFLCGQDCECTTECPGKPATPKTPVFPKFEKDKVYDTPRISKEKPDSAPGRTAEGEDFSNLASRITQNSGGAKISEPPAGLKGLVDN